LVTCLADAHPSANVSKNEYAIIAGWSETTDT
jgi:hypothetical protein